MPHASDKIASLIGSRICHDLISPVGAVANGLELLELSGMPQSPEMALVAESAGNATARIRFFRLAFGDARSDQRVASDEVAAILAGLYTGSRIEIDWRVSGEHPRDDMKSALLALLCAEEAMTTGGRITVTETDGAWRIAAEAPELTPDAQLWAGLDGSAPPDGEISPAAVQFLLLPVELTRQGRNCTVKLAETVVEISF